MKIFSKLTQYFGNFVERDKSSVKALTRLDLHQMPLMKVYLLELLIHP